LIGGGGAGEGSLDIGWGEGGSPIGCGIFGRKDESAGRCASCRFIRLAPFSIRISIPAISFHAQRRQKLIS